MQYIYCHSAAEHLADILVFATGSAEIPSLGFEPQPTITFGHQQDFHDDHTAEFPYANTCSISLRLPVLYSFDDFEQNMNAAIMHATTFSAA